MFLKGKLDEMSAKLAAVEKESENERRENERRENEEMKVCTFLTLLYCLSALLMSFIYFRYLEV